MEQQQKNGVLPPPKKCYFVSVLRIWKPIGAYPYNLIGKLSIFLKEWDK